MSHALRAFGVDARGLWCADLGCSTGGFTDCLLQGGAARVFAVDTGYGVLAWTLRTDPRVVVTGYVDDIRPYVRKAAVYVVPLRVGGGTRLKVLDAMAMGKAMVSTSIGY